MSGDSGIASAGRTRVIAVSFVVLALLILPSCEMMGPDEEGGAEGESVRGFDISLNFSEIRIVGDCDQDLVIDRGPGEFGYRIGVFASEASNSFFSGIPLGNWADSDESTFGVVVIEVIFVYPGMGQYLVDHVTKRDVPVVQAVGLIFAAVYIGLNIIADIAAIVANPRLRHPK